MKLELKPLIKEDLSFYLKVRNNPDTRKWLGNIELLTLKDAIEWFEKTTPEWFVIIVNDIQVGILKYITSGRNYIQLGIDILPEYRRRGYARLSYIKILERIDREGNIAFLWLFEDNMAYYLYKELGFNETGEEREYNGKREIKMLRFKKDEKLIPVFKPCMNEEEITAIANVIRSGWLGTGSQTKLFEQKFAEYIGIKYAIGVNSCTAGLHLAIKILDLPENSEIITTPMTFISTNHAILYNNCMPVFCDIEADTLNIDAEKIEQLITDKTKAIICVHYGGYACDMDKIKMIAKKYNLKIIEDTAHGCGGSYKDKKLGSIGDVNCFSFHAVKNLATGDGGMITTNDENIYERLLRLRWCGITKDTFSRNDKQYSWYYDISELGYKYQMNDIAASIGIIQLAKLDKANQVRGTIVNIYNEALKNIKGIEIPVRKDYQIPAYHNYVIKYDDRNELNDYLKYFGISTGVHYIPSNHYELYKKYRSETPVSDNIWERLLTLPLFPELTIAEINKIIMKIIKFC